MGRHIKRDATLLARFGGGDAILNGTLLIKDATCGHQDIILNGTLLHKDATRVIGNSAC